LIVVLVVPGVTIPQVARGVDASAPRRKSNIEEPEVIARFLRARRRATTAGLLLTTEVMIAEAPKDDSHALDGGAPGGMCGMGGTGGMDM